MGARRDARTRWTGAGASAAASDKANATASDAEPVKLLTSDESENLLKIRHTVRWKCEAWGDLRGGGSDDDARGASGGGLCAT